MTSRLLGIAVVIVLVLIASWINYAYAKQRHAFWREEIERFRQDAPAPASTPHLTKEDIAKIHHELGLDTADDERRWFDRRELAIVIIGSVGMLVIALSGRPHRGFPGETDSLQRQ
jgi:hypothetical protein